MGKFFEPCSGSNVSKSIASFKLRKEALGQSKSGIASRQFSSQYKGVVPQHNGKWGAQIYVSHQRLWLGTFNSEVEAALAYDRACLKFRSAEGPRNLLNGKQCQIENNFQELYTKEQVIQMIKDHSYPEKFNYFISVKSRDPAEGGESCNKNIKNVRRYGQFMVNPEHLFDKEVTPSDVGKLNRLVVPKQHAERNFPLESQINDRDETLVFLDENNKEWEFRYSFWKSSQSYVLTRGWSRFVKEKQLQAKDIVSFQRCRDTGKLYISVTHRPTYSRPPAHTIGCQQIAYSSPFAHLVVNPHDQNPLQFCNKNSVFHSSVLPVQMGYYSECVDNGGIQLGEESYVEGRLSNIDMRREAREHSLFPTHETLDVDGVSIAGQSLSRSSQMPRKETTRGSIRLFGVEIGTAMQNQ